MMEKDMGAFSGSREPDPASGSGPAGFDPARSMLARVARSLWFASATCLDKEGVWDGLSASDREPYVRGALCALAAMREPTEDMIEASNREWDGRMSHRSSGAWRAMIDAAIGVDAAHWCEGCGAPLFYGDRYLVDENGVAGCWATMTDETPHVFQPCYARRVGKDEAFAYPDSLEGSRE